MACLRNPFCLVNATPIDIYRYVAVAVERTGGARGALLGLARSDRGKVRYGEAGRGGVFQVV